MIIEYSLWILMYAVMSIFWQDERMLISIDPRVVAKIKEPVDQGIVNVNDIQVMVRAFINAELFSGQQIPPFADRRFNPSHKDIYNVV